MAVVSLAQFFVRCLLRLWAKARWHWYGVLLWLVQRPFLRGLPLPYPGLTTCAQYVERQLRSRHVGVQAWISEACFKDLVTLRGRMGTKLAFLGCAAMEAAMQIAVRPSGAARQIQMAAAAAASAAVSGWSGSGRHPLVGKRGGLPSSKSELIILATDLGCKPGVHTNQQLKDMINAQLKAHPRPDWQAGPAHDAVTPAAPRATAAATSKAAAPAPPPQSAASSAEDLRFAEQERKILFLTERLEAMQQKLEVFDMAEADESMMEGSYVDEEWDTSLAPP